MRLSTLLLSGSLLLLPCGISPMVASAAAYVAPSDAPARFTVADSMQVPGRTLKAGLYTIRVVDHLSDRMIVRVDKDGKQQSTFLALPSSALAKPSGSGPITIGSSTKSAMRGFAFSDGTVAEFVYPKGEAVDLAKANDTTIPAIDPVSEGRSSGPDLSKSDMEMVTLWMLSPTPVGPSDAGPGIKAERYQQVASAQTPPRPKPRPKPVMAVLPHTASQQTVIEILALATFAGALALNRRRLSA